MAHVPNINDFVGGLKILLKHSGTVTMEFPHLLQLITQNQFDTIYHEHFSYLSLYTVQQIFQFHHLTIYDVDELSTHGGSLRIYAKHNDNKEIEISNNVANLIEKEKQFGLLNTQGYKGFQQKANKVKYDFLHFLIEQHTNNKTVVAYGAAANGNTLLNYCGIKKDLITFAVDKSPYKQGKYLPANHIPVVDESWITHTKPNFVVILPWNIKDEIMVQLSYIRQWNAKFVIPIPKLEII